MRVARELRKERDSGRSHQAAACTPPGKRLGLPIEGVPHERVALLPVFSLAQSDGYISYECKGVRAKRPYFCVRLAPIKTLTFFTDRLSRSQDPTPS